MVRSPILECEELCMGMILPPAPPLAHVPMSKIAGPILCIVAGGCGSLASPE